MKKTLKRHGSPENITTDGLRSYRAAMNELFNADKQEVGRWANNRVENNHLSLTTTRAVSRPGAPSEWKFSGSH
jgi:putative transposase